MSNLAIDRDYLQYQYGDAEKLRIRQQSHALYSEQAQSFFDWLLSRIDLRPGMVLLDVGCGCGAFHPLLRQPDSRIIGVDASRGMVQETRRQALQQHLPVLAVQADAEALPLPAACCDRVMANHMLFHVPNQLAALHQMRRVLKPRGRVILATNAADSGTQLMTIHQEAARQLGYTPLEERITDRFNLDHLALVREVFPNAERHFYRDAFIFPSVDAALQYYASGMVDLIEDLPADGSHRARLMPQIRAHIAALIAEEGALRVPKDAGCFVAEV